MSAIVLDTETTGLDNEARIVEIAIIDFDTHEVFLHTKINPQVPIPEEVSAIHGITDEMVKDAPVFATIADKILQLISTTEAIIGCNPWFDQRMIGNEFVRYGKSTEHQIDIRWPILICTKRMWDLNESKVERNLTNQYKRFVDPAGFDGAHGALADTIAAAKVLAAQIKEYKIDHKSWNDFDPSQIQWFGPSDHILKTEDGFLECNFGKNKGKKCHEIDSGYWKWITEKDFPTHVKEIAKFLVSVKPDANRMRTYVLSGK